MVSSQDIAGYLQVVTGIPAPMWAAIVSLLTGAMSTWAAEFLVPMEEWGQWKFRARVWVLSVAAGTGLAAVVWHDWTVVVMCVPALLGEIGREVLSRRPRFNWLSPRETAIVTKLNAAGDFGVKVGSNPTIYAPRTQPGSVPHE